jgi:hypothetical protein
MQKRPSIAIRPHIPSHEGEAAEAGSVERQPNRAQPGRQGPEAADHEHRQMIGRENIARLEPAPLDIGGIEYRDPRQRRRSSLCEGIRLDGNGLLPCGMIFGFG